MANTSALNGELAKKGPVARMIEAFSGVGNVMLDDIRRGQAGGGFQPGAQQATLEVQRALTTPRDPNAVAPPPTPMSLPGQASQRGVEAAPPLKNGGLLNLIGAGLLGQNVIEELAAPMTALGTPFVGTGVDVADMWSDPTRHTLGEGVVAGGAALADIIPGVAQGKAATTALIGAMVKGGSRLDAPTDAAIRLNRLIKRKEGVGAQKNDRTVLTATGKPDIVVGRQTPEDWLARIQANLSPEEMERSSQWYRQVRGVFDEAFGSEGDTMMLAWLLGNKNESPVGALRNALRVAEQVKTGTTGKKGGLNDAAIRALLNGERPKGGVGQKLYDFVDSAVESETRTLYGNVAEAGKPAVVDVHSFRDMGYVDPTYKDFLESQGYDVSGLKLDTLAGPSETQYENAARQMRDLTQSLNDTGALPRNLEPSEVQAIGWAAMRKQFGYSEDLPIDLVKASTRRVAFELAPGAGSPLDARFGERFNALPLDEQSSVTKLVLEDSISSINEMLGVQSSNVIFGTGGWQKYENPAVVNEILSSPETADTMANMLGWLTQQTEVWVSKTKGMTKSPKAFGITISGRGLDNDETIRKLWGNILDDDTTDLIQGYQPITIDGEPGILVLIDKGGAPVSRRIDDEVIPIIEKLVKNTEESGRITTRLGEFEIRKHGNVGGEGYDGNIYKQRLVEGAFEDRIPDLDSLRSKLEAKFGEAISKAEARQARQSGKQARPPETVAPEANLASLAGE